MTTKGERTRRRLIDVAMARFERDGFGSTTMRTVARLRHRAAPRVLHLPPR